MPLLLDFSTSTDVVNKTPFCMLTRAKSKFQPRTFALDAALAPYEAIKEKLGEARARYRELTAGFIEKLRLRCGAMKEDESRGLDEYGRHRPPPSEAPHLYQESPLGCIPCKWETVLLGQISTIQTGDKVGAASLKNFAAIAHDWFERNLSEFNLYLMPLSFVELPSKTDALILSSEEKNFLAFLEKLEKPHQNPSSRYSVSVNIEVKFTRSKAKDALSVQLTNDPNAPAIRVTEEQIREKYPWAYDKLTDECQKRYAGFKVDKAYHNLRKQLQADSKFGATRFFDPGNPKSAKKPFFNPNILSEFDKHYRKRSSSSTP